MGNNTSTKSKQLRSSVCEVCTSSYQCGKLSSALEILKQAVHRGDEATREEYAAIHDQLRETGYAYPAGIKFCELKDQNAEINDMIDRATQILSEIRKAKFDKVG